MKTWLMHVYTKHKEGAPYPHVFIGENKEYCVNSKFRCYTNYVS